MSLNVRIRNGMEPDMGSGGASEGDIRGDASDAVANAGVVDLVGGHLLVHQSVSPDMNVIVDKGVVYIPNASFDEEDSDQVRFWEAVVAGTTGSRTLAIGSNSSGSTRIDLICAKLDTGVVPDSTASNIATLVVVAGTPGAGAPATPSNHELLAEVTVVNGASSIADAAISDERRQIKLNYEFLPKKRVVEVASGTSLTPNGNTTDIYDIPDLAHNTTINAPTGTLADGQTLIIRIKDAGVAKTIAWNAIFRAIATYLPSTTVANKVLYVGAIYNATDTKWDVLATQQEA